jgi:hypothetical protein
MTEVKVKMELSDDRITKIVVEDYEFMANVPIEFHREIKKLFERLHELGVCFKREEDKKEEEKKIKEFIKHLTEKQKCILRQFKNRDIVKKDELKDKCGDLRGPLAGLTKKAQSKGLIGENEKVLEFDGVNNVYRLNSKLRRAVNLL